MILQSYPAMGQDLCVARCEEAVHPGYSQRGLSAKSCVPATLPAVIGTSPSALNDDVGWHVTVSTTPCSDFTILKLHVTIPQALRLLKMNLIQKVNTIHIGPSVWLHSWVFSCRGEQQRRTRPCAIEQSYDQPKKIGGKRSLVLKTSHCAHSRLCWVRRWASASQWLHNRMLCFYCYFLSLDSEHTIEKFLQPQK